MGSEKQILNDFHGYDVAMIYDMMCYFYLIY